ncbi:MAG: FAD/NAD(P)-binding oxidoreductase [Candidatus Spechtbacterales bacterium]|nr:FAD/NAD(P)-binding oxidoreductase [Candidatus Spechtbacterales bacterium]
MKKIIIIGAGTAGTIIANKLQKINRNNRFEITVIDKQSIHYYQPGYLFLPFGKLEEHQVKKDKKDLFIDGVNLEISKVSKIDAENNRLIMEDGNSKPYDLLVIATGVNIRPDETEGMTGDLWYKNIFDFYTMEGAKKLREALKSFNGGDLVMHIVEMPIKCPVAPLEFVFLVDEYLRDRGIRDKTNIKYVTPLEGAFTRPLAAKKLGGLLEERNIKIVPNFGTEKIDNEQQMLLGYDGREVGFDLLVTVPTNMGSNLIESSGLGNELNLVPTNQYSLQSKKHKNIFVAGDASDIPASKAGSVAHFQAETIITNILRYFKGKKMKESFKGHANCFIETGDNKGVMIDFDYDNEPNVRKIPFEGIGPFSGLSESRINHWGKVTMRQYYWNILLKDRFSKILNLIK